MMTNEEFNDKPAGDPNLTPAERKLSELVYRMYHSNRAVPARRSSVSDTFARRLRNNQDLALELAQAILPVAVPEFRGTVLGFAVEQPSLLDTLLAGLRMNQEPKAQEPKSLVLPSGHLNHAELWARAAKLLSNQGYKNVRYNHAYAEFADDVYSPAIIGEKVDCTAVNYAMMQILKNNELGGLISVGPASWMAVTQSMDGWVRMATA